jgi:hypothetical protein
MIDAFCHASKPILTAQPLFPLLVVLREIPMFRLDPSVMMIKHPETFLGLPGLQPVQPPAPLQIRRGRKR